MTTNNATLNANIDATLIKVAGREVTGPIVADVLSDADNSHNDDSVLVARFTKALLLAALKERHPTLKGMSGKSKPEVVRALRTGDKPAKSAPKAGTVADLRQQVKAAFPNVKGLSSASKAVLEHVVATGSKPEAGPPKEGTKADLLAKAKARFPGMTGLAGLNKGALETLLATGSKPAPTPDTVAGLKALLSLHNVPQRSKMVKREQMVEALVAIGVLSLRNVA